MCTSLIWAVRVRSRHFNGRQPSGLGDYKRWTQGPGTQGPEDQRTGDPGTRGPEDRGPKDQGPNDLALLHLAFMTEMQFVSMF